MIVVVQMTRRYSSLLAGSRQGPHHVHDVDVFSSSLFELQCSSVDIVTAGLVFVSPMVR
jgi:hypothetical protein